MANSLTSSFSPLGDAAIAAIACFRIELLILNPSGLFMF
jgi:hypothetical protein